MATPSDRRPQDSLRPPGSKLRVLFVGATPTDTARIAVGEEYRHVDAAVRTSDNAGRFEFHFAHEVRAGELGPALLRHRPHIVHFSGHGSASGELLLPDASGQAAPAKPEKLAQLFDVVGRDLSIRCVVLNACYSEALAKALAAQVDCVIGVPTALKDKVAVAFAGAFYQAIGFGRDLDAAYRYACAQVDLAVPSRAALPTIHCREGVRAEELRFFPAPRATAVERAESAASTERAVALDPALGSGGWRWLGIAAVACLALAGGAALVRQWVRESRPHPVNGGVDAGGGSHADGSSPPDADMPLVTTPSPPAVVFRGRITYQGRSLRGARVAVQGADCSATTDARGAFEIQCRAASLPRHPEGAVLMDGGLSERFPLHSGGARYSVDARGRVTVQVDHLARGAADPQDAPRVEAPSPTAPSVTLPPPSVTPLPPCAFDDPGCNRIAP